MNRRGFSLVIAVATLVAANVAASAQDYKGAIESLRAVEEIRRGSAPKKPATPVSILRQEMLAFRSQSANLAADVAAKEWLGFVDRFLAQVGAPSADVTALDFDELIAVLPPPSAWKALSARIRVRPAGKYPVVQTCMCLLADTLIGDAVHQSSDIGRLEAQVVKLTNVRGSGASELMHLKHQLALRSRDKARIAKSLDFMLSLGRTDGQFAFDSTIPDVVKLVGKTEGERLLRKAVLLPEFRGGYSDSEETKSLIRRITLEMVDKLKAPHWDLVDAADPISIPLFEAMERRFHPKQSIQAGSAIARAVIEEEKRSRGTDDSQSARLEYLLCLACWGRMDDALKIAQSIRLDTRNSNVASNANELINKGRVQPLYGFLHTALGKNPNLGLWDAFPEASKASGHRAELIPFLKSALGRPGLTVEARTEIRGALQKELLGDDRIDEAVAILRAMMKESASDFGQHESESNGTNLAGLGKALKRQDWIEEGNEANRKRLIPRLKDSPFLGTSIAELLVEHGQGPGAERALVEAIAATPDNLRSRNMGGYGSSPENQLLDALIAIYHRAGRHQDVLALFEHATEWDIGDLADGGAYLSGQNFLAGTERPLAFIAAAALAATGRKSEALPLIEATLYNQPSFDPGFQLMIEIRGIEALPYLDHLHKLNRFEERPLIWKAQLLQKDGRLDEAEQAARQAVSLDPCDDDAGPGRRMLAHAVLAGILEERGEKAEADRLRQQVRAIRVAEEGDEFANAGLITRAIGRYNEAVKLNPDSYCIHSRLATRLWEVGRYQEADEHYRRMFEILPEVVGRNSNRCPECTEAFSEKRAQAIAEKVFSELAAKSPNDARIQILLGELKAVEERHDLALAHYRKAASLDPQSMIAWQGVSTSLTALRAPQAEIDTATCKMLKGGGVAFGQLSDCVDLTSLWDATEVAQETSPPDPPERLYPLPASAMKLRAEGDRRFVRSDSILSNRQPFGFFSFRLNRGVPPGEALSQHVVIGAIERVLSASLPQR